MTNINTGTLSGNVVSVGELKDYNGWKSCFCEISHKKEWTGKDGVKQVKTFKNSFKADNEQAKVLQSTKLGSGVVVQYELESYEKPAKDGSQIYNNTSIVIKALEFTGAMIENPIETKGAEEQPF
jgi:hypothetical protein